MNSITTNREFFSEFLVKQTSAGGLWEAVAPLPGGRGLPGGLGGRPLRCRATEPPGVSEQILSENFCRKAPAAPQRGDQAAGYISVNFKKNIFVKNENKK